MRLGGKRIGGSRQGRQGIQPNSFPCWMHSLLVGFSDFCPLSLIGIIVCAVPGVEVTN